METRDIITILRSAINRVEEVYYGNQSWIDSMLNAHSIYSEDPRREKLIPYLTRHHERVFCYELYHHFRLLLNERNQKHIILQGELRKEQVGAEIEELFDIKRTDGVYYPDFVLHEAGTFNNQELVIEVKANPKVSFTDLCNDILKIDELISKYQYKKGVFLSINVTPERYHTFIENDVCRSWYRENIQNKKEILLMFKEGANKPIYSRNLANIVQ